MLYDPTQQLPRLRQTVQWLQQTAGDPPAAVLVLGSGLGDFIDDLPDKRSIPYADIPGFPLSTVVGHSGKMTLARGGLSRFAALQGRVHLYEGQPPAETVFAVRAMALWGASDFVITNAAGAINTSFQAGDLMLITDHLNLLGDNPLCGPNLDELGARFPDMTHAYSPRLQTLARECAADVGLALREGIYAAVKGPSYETPAEIRMLRAIGADAVGMSTVPEVIALNHMTREVLGVSCLTNMAAGILGEKMKHEDVLETTRRVKGDFARLLSKILERLSDRG